MAGVPGFDSGIAIAGQAQPTELDTLNSRAIELSQHSFQIGLLGGAQRGQIGSANAHVDGGARWHGELCAGLDQDLRHAQRKRVGHRTRAAFCATEQHRSTGQACVCADQGIGLAEQINRAGRAFTRTALRRLQKRFELGDFTADGIADFSSVQSSGGDRAQVCCVAGSGRCHGSGLHVLDCREQLGLRDGGAGLCCCNLGIGSVQNSAVGAIGHRVQRLTQTRIIGSNAVSRIGDRRGGRSDRGSLGIGTQSRTFQHVGDGGQSQAGHADHGGRRAQGGGDRLHSRSQRIQADAARTGVGQLGHRLHNRINLLLLGEKQLASGDLLGRAVFHGRDRIEGGEIDVVSNAQGGLELGFSDVAERQQGGQRRNHAKAGGRQELAHGLAGHGIYATHHHDATHRGLGGQIQTEIALRIGGAGNITLPIHAKAGRVVKDRCALHIAIDRFGGIRLGDTVNLNRQ